MKNFLYRTILLSVMMIFVQQLGAQEYHLSQVKLKRAIEAYEWSLQNSHTAIVESSIYNVILLKHYYPRQNYDGIQGVLGKLAMNGATPVIRSKAYMAMMYINYPDLFENIDLKAGIEDASPYFRQILDNIELSVFASN